jgi:tetratricopeptide (TPR) repeat protein
MAFGFGLRLGVGRHPLARSRLDEGQKRFPNDDRFPAYQARAALLSGDTALARQTVESARKRFPESVELGLVDGELGRLDGNGAVAVARFGSATEKAPADFRAWQGLGVTLAEQEDFDPARAALTKAIGLVPQVASPLADLGALETRAQRLSQAQVAIDQSLVLAPDDYVAWTSRGILLLAQGKPEAALEALLKAGLLEPRYARAQLYTAIAWYQIGRDDAALAALERTKKADPNDPLPYFYEAQIHRDGLNPTAAIAAAREAMARFQFLKSLGPLLPPTGKVMPIWVQPMRCLVLNPGPSGLHKIASIRFLRVLIFSWRSVPPKLLSRIRR